VTPDGGRHRFFRDREGVLCREHANGTGEALVFDINDRLLSRACWRRSTGVVSTTWASRYRYDASGLLQEILDSELGATRFAYDADSRLIAQQGPGSARFEYHYDAANNLNLTPAHGRIETLPNNLIAYSFAERFEYDARQRLAKRTRPDGVETRYAFDSNDQLVGVTFGDRSEVWRAAYDGLGRRLWREYGGLRTDFYWDGDRLAGEIAPDGSLRVYVYPNDDALIPFMWFDYSSATADPASGVASYLFCAPTGMPIRVEDAVGHVIWQAAQVEPYGATRGGALPPTRLRFAGHFYDEHLELFYNRFRDFDPGLARYLQPDPLGHAGGLNLYAYPANPAVDVDLRGLVHRAKKPAEGGGEQGGEKKPAKDADAADADSSASRRARDRELAAAPNDGPDGRPSREQMAARKHVAAEHLLTHGRRYDRASGKLVPLTRAERKDQLKGIDYGHPVVSGPPPAMPAQLTQWQVPGNSRGSYFAPAGSTPGELGIGDKGRAWSKPGAPVENKVANTHTIKDPDNQTYLMSTAAPIDDTWSVPAHGSDPAMVQPTPGGGSQYCVYEGADPSYPGIT
jgi:RHS repeat-associated protein